MEISINNNKKIAEIQQEFNDLFPYLKIAFFTKPKHSGGHPNLKFHVNSVHTIGECRSIQSEIAQIIISPAMTVHELETGLGTLFGLGVQVFRQSGKVWLETTFTDGWTLEMQNIQGEDLSKVAV